MRDPNEALVYLSRRESRLPNFHPRLMFVSALYASGATHVSIGIDEDERFPSDGVVVHLPAARSLVAGIEEVINTHREAFSRVKQRGSTVRIFW